MLNEKVTYQQVIAVFLFSMALLLQGCSAPSGQKAISQKEADQTPYGEWLLLNPQDMQENLVAGGLIACREAVTNGDSTLCSDNGYMLVVLERNFGYGCTDYVTAGAIEYNLADKNWYLISDAGDSGKNERLRVERNGKQLYLYPEKGSKLIFQRSSVKAIEKKVDRMCKIVHSPD
ncbi:hypothetical protein [Endozoicomonas sp. Mp262]|uniref:hypothetical protein n=1 Tax=Endozoicomonas sp. Mp262 TaxID=2919499 RepID=UPI0021D82076